jgi:hypothetical protein
VPSRALGASITALALTLSACGGGERSDPGDTGRAYTTQQVIDVFRTQTGERLAPEPGASAPTYDALSPPRAFNDTGQLTDHGWRLAERFGAFTIYVTRGESTLRTLLAGGGRPGEPGRRGVRVHRDETGYTVRKRYGNVVLTWIGGRSRETDGRFRALDRALSALPR